MVLTKKVVKRSAPVNRADGASHKNKAASSPKKRQQTTAASPKKEALPVPPKPVVIKEELQARESLRSAASFERPREVAEAEAEEANKLVTGSVFGRLRNGAHIFYCFEGDRKGKDFHWYDGIIISGTPRAPEWKTVKFTTFPNEPLRVKLYPANHNSVRKVPEGGWHFCDSGEDEIFLSEAEEARALEKAKASKRKLKNKK